LLNHLLLRYSKKARHEGKIESKRFERVEADSRSQVSGVIYTPLTCGFGNFEGATGSAVASLFEPMERDIKIHLFFSQKVAYIKK
jgi:hypothetical protein